MKLWGKNSEPTLTRLARELCTTIDTLDETGKENAAKTIQSMFFAIRSLGSMPESITQQLWSIMLTIIRKAMMPGSEAEKMFGELNGGLTEDFRAMLERHTR